MSNYNKSDTGKWIVAFTLIFVLLVGMCATLFMVFKDDMQPTPEQGIEDTTDIENDVVNEDGTEMVSGPVYAMSKSMTFSSPSLLSNTARAGITLSCQVYPITASNKAVDWSVAWVNPNSAFASGKSAETYLSVTPTTSGSTTANVVCNSAFGEPINIIVTSRDNPDITATCVVDYQKRMTGYTVTLFGQSATVNLGGTAKISLSSSSTAKIGNVTPTAAYGVGTVNNSSGSVDNKFLALDLYGIHGMIETHYTNVVRSTLSAVRRMTADNAMEDMKADITKMIVDVALRPENLTFKDILTPFVQMAVITGCVDYFSELLTTYPIAVLRAGTTDTEYGDVEVFVTDGVLQLALSEENLII